MNYKHGMAKHGSVSPTYRAWQAMRKRCDGKASSSAYYEGRIAVCERWQSFDHFLADMGERPVGMSLDRIDNDKGYAPDNCRWATHTQQMQNTRHNVNLTLNGETKCVAEWARVLGIPKARIHARLTRGWSADRALAVA